MENPFTYARQYVLVLELIKIFISQGVPQKSPEQTLMKDSPILYELLYAIDNTDFNTIIYNAKVLTLSPSESLQGQSPLRLFSRYLKNSSRATCD